MKKKSTIMDNGIGSAAMRLAGHRTIRCAIGYYAKLLKIQPNIADYVCRTEFSPHQEEIIATLIRAGNQPAEACEIAKNCDEAPAWL
jgi:hypothetical protein